MKLETIKKDKRKKIIIGSMIVLSVVGCLTLTTSRAKYKSVQSVKLASGIVKLSSYDFKIMAMYQSEDGTNYTDINTMPETGYIINEEKSYCTTDNKTEVKGKLKTIDGNHVMIGLNKNDKCYIWFDKYVPTASEILITSFETYNGYKGNSIPDFTAVAISAETIANNGIYVADDPMYGVREKTYYWRGAATTNHVIFDNKCWRIVRINGDGSIRLIYNGGIQSGNTCKGNGANADSVVLKGTVYNSTRDNSKYVGWTYSTSNIQRPSTNVPQDGGEPVSLKTALETWYSNNITDKSKVIKGYFCNDRDTQNNEAWIGTGDTQYYAASQRLSIGSKTPLLSCSNGDKYLLNVGMITADEVQFAGASWSTNNQSYYLYNGQYYWTMTPFHWYNYNSYNREARVFFVHPDGYLGGVNVDNTNYGVRPVINLRSDVTFNLGSDGTQNYPYIVQ